MLEVYKVKLVQMLLTYPVVANGIDWHNEVI